MLLTLSTRGILIALEAQRPEGEGTIPIRLHMIKESGSCEAWYISPHWLSLAE